MIEKSNYQILKSVYLTKVIQYDYGAIVQSNWINNPWYNHAYIDQVKTWTIKNVNDFILIYNLYFKMKKSCIYLPEELKEIGLFLKTQKYYVFEKENWWYFDAFSIFQRVCINDFIIYELTDEYSG